MGLAPRPRSAHACPVPTSRFLGLATWAPLVLVLACVPSEPPGSSDDTTGPDDDTTAATGIATTSTTLPEPSSGPGDPSSSGAATVTTDASATTTTDASTTAPADSTGTEDTTGAEPALGMLSGDCGLIDAMELDAGSAFTFENAIDFRELGFDYDLLTPEGQQVFDAGNLGGSSLHSEVIAFEVLARCDGAGLLATEGEIQYVDPMGTKTDLLVELDGRVVGVSVTRAVGFPFDAPYTEMHAATLLTGKLEDILESTANVAPPDAWVKQILHVIAYADMHAQSILAAYATLPPELTADTILLVTVTHGNDEFIY